MEAFATPVLYRPPSGKIGDDRRNAEAEGCDTHEGADIAADRTMTLINHCSSLKLLVRYIIKIESVECDQDHANH